MPHTGVFSAYRGEGLEGCALCAPEWPCVGWKRCWQTRNLSHEGGFLVLVIGLAVLVVMAFAIACGEPERTDRLPTYTPLPAQTALLTYTPIPTAIPLPRGLNAPHISSTNHLGITPTEVKELLEPQGFTSFQQEEDNIIYRVFTNESHSQITYTAIYRITSPNKIRRAAINTLKGERVVF